MTAEVAGTIGSAVVSSEALVVDGARFHLVWLRDNCPCAICQDPGTWQKLFDITATDLAPSIRSSDLTDDALRIVWRESPPHASVYPRAWLREHAYDAPKPPARSTMDMWHEPRAVVPRRPDDPAWRAEVLRRGFALLTGLDQEGFEQLLHETGPITPTEFGEIAPLRARPDANDIGETGLPLDPHTDYMVYMQFPPTLSFLHCVRNDSDGGSSILVDGFAAAECFRQRDPAGFELLLRTRLPFHQLYGRWRYHHLRERPVIEIDDCGAVTGIYAGHAHTRDWRLPFEEMIPFYAAYAGFTRLLNDPARQLRHRLQPGECFAFQNERVLHGRTGFDAGTGERHLQIGYVNWSYFTARERFNQR